VDVDYPRTYWALFVACGVLLVVGEVPSLLAGRIGLGTAISLLVGGFVAISGAYALGTGEERGAPDSLDLRFGILLLAFVFILFQTATLLFA
jgi:1,4-dihydroxy-2-naphthoate octaprenyltransferase